MSYDPKKMGARCDLCPRRGQPVIAPTGPKHMATTLWIGQDPGQQEVKAGAPFTGAMGVRLQHMWDRSCEAERGVIPRNTIWATNAALCPPTAEKNERESREATICCRPRLAAELMRASPHAGILLMGKWAYFALTGKVKGVGALLGFHIEVRPREVKALAADEVKKLEAKRAKAKKKGAK